MIVGQMVKEPNEEIAVGIDFSAELETGETIITVIDATAKNYATLLDSTTTFLTPVAATIVGATVSVRCRGGLHGETHLVQLRVSTTLGNIFEHEVEVAVAES